MKKLKKLTISAEFSAGAIASLRRGDVDKSVPKSWVRTKQLEILKEWGYDTTEVGKSMAERK